MWFGCLIFRYKTFKGTKASHSLHLSSSFLPALPPFARLIAYKHWGMMAQSERRLKRNHSAQWRSLLHHDRKESPHSFVCFLFSLYFPHSVSLPPCILLQNGAVFFGSVVKCLHAQLCCTELQCGSPGKMVQSMRGITVWYFPPFWGY